MKNNNLRKIKNENLKIEKGSKLTFCEKLKKNLTFKNEKKS